MRYSSAATSWLLLTHVLSVAPAFAVDEAATDVAGIESIVVTATRLGQSVTETGSSITVLTSKELERFGQIYALDAIANVPGVTINQNGTFGGAATVRIRGASSEQTVVLIDGIPVNDPTSPGGGFNFARLDTANIERIEVLRGPQSTLWGTDAIGGVVSVTTKAPAERLSGDVFAEYGAFDTFRGGASVSNSSELGDFRVAAVTVTSDGISKADEENGNTEEDSFESQTLSAKGGLNLPGGARLSVDALWTDAETEFDSFFFGAEGSVADGDEVSETEELAANVALALPLLQGKLENLLLVGYSDIQRDNFSDGLPSFGAEGERLLYRYQGTLTANEHHRVAFGVEREETTANDDETSIDGLFALYEASPTEALTLTLGLRNDDHERFGSELTGRVAGSWRLSDRLSVRASWGEGFKAPTIFQTTFFCCGATAPNADLEPETSEAFDVGVDWTSLDNRVQLSATVFQQDTENLIDFDFAIGGYLNIAEVESTGIELAGAVALSDALSLSLDYAFIDAEDGAGNQLVRLPEQTGDLSLTYEATDRFSAAVLVRYNGSEENTNGTTLDSWVRVDLTGRFAVTDGVEVYGRIENLFDEEYQQILGYGTPGIAGTHGIRARF
ncbi:MAG: TonB-dependent receptor [Pseudomonadota bacterium]